MNGDEPIFRVTDYEATVAAQRRALELQANRERNTRLRRYESHRDEAERLLLEADDHGDLSDVAINLAARAQAHATLALIYQRELRI